MKILELRFKNLNSLYGEWLIDFTNPEYALNGIFALTGPTGAGKSTILDAICLALYGATPRLGKITKSGNDIMSRQTGECYAEVLFESQAGIYRCHWEQRRARKNPDGRLQDQEHQIADGISGKLIETKKSQVVHVIEAKTGMDFDRFTRSILLAQGGFDTFLRADSEQKSRILEQITGTEIYSEISRRVHESQRSEQAKLDVLLAETKGIEILTPELEAEIQLKLSDQIKQEEKLDKVAIQITKSITWLENIQTLKNDISGLNAEAEKLKADNEAFKSQKKRLDLANQASALDGAYATLGSLRKQLAADQDLLKNNIDSLPDLERASQSLGGAFETAKQNRQKAKDELTKLAPLIQEVRLLDQSIKDQTVQIADNNVIYKGELAKLKKYELDLSNKINDQSKAEVRIQEFAGYLQKHAQDEWLISGFAGIKERLRQLITEQEKAFDKEKQYRKTVQLLSDADQKFAGARQQCSESELKQKTLINALQQAKQVLADILAGKLLREYRTENMTLLREKAYRQKIADLEEHRTLLEDGKPCPLCGAEHHPYAEGNIPAIDEIDEKIAGVMSTIQKAEDQEEQINNLSKSLNTANETLNNFKSLQLQAKSNKENINLRLAEISEEKENLDKSYAQLKHQILDSLRPFEITSIPDDEIQNLLNILESRIGNWQAKLEQKTNAEKLFAEINNDIKLLNGLIATQSKTLEDSKNNLAQLSQSLQNKQARRQELFGDKKPDFEQSRLSQAITDAEADEAKLRDLHNAQQLKLSTTKNNIEAIKNRIGQKNTELIKIESDFLNACRRIGFLDEQAYLEAIMSYEQRAALLQEAKALELRETQLRTRQFDRQQSLALELAKNITDKTLDELHPQINQCRQELALIRDAIATQKHRLVQNQLAKNRIKEKQLAIENQQKECSKWDKLHALIGSADGKKYRNFAQGLTFELMVSHANRQLEKMTDRYLLIRDDAQPLELNVVDNYQAGEIRSTKNLSGGESFIVSLSLALGLSKMASKKVRVDSLFLDEGFGTLDEDALETALESLAGLNQDGKLIGVISHVPALKERISTQINIRPITGGKSIVTGPGCERIKA